MIGDLRGWEAWEVKYLYSHLVRSRGMGKIGEWIWIFDGLYRVDNKIFYRIIYNDAREE
jgi:hypothetical protein